MCIILPSNSKIFVAHPTTVFGAVAKLLLCYDSTVLHSMKEQSTVELRLSRPKLS